MRGWFITFEGIEGSGKSSQISLLTDYLRSNHRAVTLTREPGGTPIGDQVRKILLDPGNKILDPSAELLLYAASRAQHLKEVIRPALQSGAIVLCDRFSDATLAYQGYGRGLDLAMIHALDRLVTAGMRPDLTIVLDVEAAVGLARARGRNNQQGLEAEARFENEALAFHERVRQGYLTLAREAPDRMKIVDAALPPLLVQEKIREIVDRCLI
ncbi:MAG: dTMP kinase [Nitrospirae bacterium GWC2_56_14]|nr:MAG: dTMP kinase [Nitrospirae bacterium GWC2_56_14]